MSCGRSPLVSHAVRPSTRRYYAGESVTYKCNAGYNPSREGITYTCLGNGHWEHPNVTCTGKTYTILTHISHFECGKERG